MPDGDDLVVVPSNAGQDRPPAWWLNLQGNPRAEVDFRGEHRVVRARRASAEEERRLWPRILEQYSGFEQYRHMTDREIPVVILEREGESNRLAGSRPRVAADPRRVERYGRYSRHGWPRRPGQGGSSVGTSTPGTTGRMSLDGRRFE